jgi:hypothetical protein
MRSITYKLFAVINTLVAKLRDVERIVGRKTVGLDQIVGLHMIADDARQRRRLHVGNHHGMHPACTLEQPEDRHLACSPATAFTFAYTAEIAFIDFDLAGKIRRLMGKDHLAQLVVEEDSRAAIDPHQFGGRSRRHAGHKLHK